MGTHKHIEELDAFTKKHLKEIELEKAPLNFTAHIMSSINQEVSVKSSVQYQPLISKKVGFTVFGLIGLSVVLFLFFGTNENLVTIPKIDFSFLQKLNISHAIKSFSLSNTTMRIIVVAAVMICIQVYYLKTYFERRIH